VGVQRLRGFSLVAARSCGRVGHSTRRVVGVPRTLLLGESFR
jgi:hypothetical protein